MFFPCSPETSTATVAVGFLVSTLILAEIGAESVLPAVSVMVFVELGKTSKEYVVVELVSMPSLGVRDTRKYCPDIVVAVVVVVGLGSLKLESECASTFVIDERLVLVFF